MVAAVGLRVLTERGGAKWVGQLVALGLMRFVLAGHCSCLTPLATSMLAV